MNMRAVVFDFCSSTYIEYNTLIGSETIKTCIYIYIYDRLAGRCLRSDKHAVALVCSEKKKNNNNNPMNAKMTQRRKGEMSSPRYIRYMCIAFVRGSPNWTMGIRLLIRNDVRGVYVYIRVSKRLHFGPRVAAPKKGFKILRVHYFFFIILHV